MKLITKEMKSSGQNLLESEACILCYLKGNGIPIAKSYGFSGNYNVLVMELLGKSLEDIFQQCGCKFSIKTVCMIAIQMLDRIEFIHSRHIIHRDIKPDNFVIGLDHNANMIYLIDFGLAKKFRSSKSLEHNPIKNNKKLTGTARYASINALRGVEQSRRDDLEAIGYVLMYFLKGVLPWQGLKVNKDEDRYKIIYDKKKNTKPEDLCSGYPNEFIIYLNYTRNLHYEQDPDYDFLRGLFKTIMTNFKLDNDYKFDWVKFNQYNSSLATTLQPNNIVLNNLQQNNHVNESNNISLDKNNSPKTNANKIMNTNTNIIINTNKNKEIQISQENVNNFKINIISTVNNGHQQNLNDAEMAKKYSISNTQGINNINYSNMPIKYDNFVGSTLHNKPNMNTLVNNSINPQEYANNRNSNINSPEEKKKDKKAKCCFS